MNTNQNSPSNRGNLKVASDPSDAGFADIGELSADSQTAINQLADLGITQGTSATTYSPDDAVQRGHMALFIARLMDKMDPFADPGAGEDDAAFAYIPKQVEDTDDKPVGSPFTDLGRTTKDAYDAITALWELGVASGINDTHYGPAQSITRAAMADFMARVLDHSNARPAGVTMQVDMTTGFGEVTAVRAISVRDDNFAPMADVSVKVFTATESGGIDDDTGKCLGADGPCDWSDNGEITNDHGNNFDKITVATTGDEPSNEENSEMWYAWMGDADNSEFVKGSSGEAMVTLTAKPDALGLRVSADINENATNSTVKIGKTKTVVLTVQLIDNAGDTDDALENANAVAREDVEIKVTAYTQTVGTASAQPVFPLPASMKTDANGQVKLEITGPEPDDDDAVTQTRADAVTFGHDFDSSGEEDTDEIRQITVNWTDADAQVFSSKPDAPEYAIIDDGKVRITITVKYYDQYGNPAGSGYRTTISVGTGSPDSDTFATSGTNNVRVRSNGIASFTGNIDATAGVSQTVAIATGLTDDGEAVPTGTGYTAPTIPGGVLAVGLANKNDDGESGNRATGAANQVIVDADNDRFIIYGDGTVGGVLYSYDSNDTFIIDNNDVDGDIDKFEEAIAKNGKTVEVVVYSPDPNGESIFTVKDTP